VPEARGVLFGLTRGTTAADLGRATLEGVAYQVVDLIEASTADAGTPLTELRVDGGMARNARFLQCQADVLGIPVCQTAQSEATALGAAMLAGWSAGVWPDLQSLRKLTGITRRFEPMLPEDARRRKLERWRRAVRAVIAYYTD
jgi:glycerol kinase